MKRINTDYYTRRGRQKRKSLVASIKKWLKKKPRGIQPIVNEAAKETWKEISCKQCGNCCRDMTPTWKKSDIKRVAAHVGITPKQFYDKWLYTDDSGDVMNTGTPCQFLNKKTNLCTIYEIRPHDCKEFPHFHRKDFVQEIDFYGDNIPRCPATLLLVEKIEAAIKK